MIYDITAINKARKKGKWVIVEEWSDYDQITGSFLWKNKRLISTHNTEKEALGAFNVYAWCEEWDGETGFYIADPIGYKEATGFSLEGLTNE